MQKLVEVSHASRRGSSIRITLPKKIQEKLCINEGDIIGFYEEGDRIILRRVD